MDNLIEKMIYSLGGGVAVAILILIFFKQLVQKYIETIIGSSAEKTIKRLEHKLAKNLSAHVILLEKEFEFYSKVDEVLGNIIVQIQDYTLYMQNKEGLERTDQCNSAKSELMSILKAIPALKSFILTYQAYIPQSVFSVTSDFLAKLQADADDMFTSLEKLCSNKVEEIDLTRISEIEKDTLMGVALIRLRTQQRLTELSNE